MYIVYVGLQESNDPKLDYLEPFIELEKAKDALAKAFEYYGGLTLAVGLIINITNNSIVYKIQ